MRRLLCDYEIVKLIVAVIIELGVYFVFRVIVAAGGRTSGRRTMNWTFVEDCCTSCVGDCFVISEISRAANVGEEDVMESGEWRRRRRREWRMEMETLVDRKEWQQRWD